MGADAQQLADIVCFTPQEANDAGCASGTFKAYRSRVPLREVFPLRGASDPQSRLHVGDAASGDVREVLLRKRSNRFSGPTCTRGHLLQPMHSFRPFASEIFCDLCTSGARTGMCCTKRERDGDGQESDRFGCAKCDFHICGACASEGQSLQGGGAFNDILTPTLANELLARETWLAFKADCYFNRADY